jgi:acetyl-CoA acetyltransferase
MSAMRSRAVVTGVGEKLGKRMNRTAFDLHMEVGRAAILDAGLMPGAIDGVLTGMPFVESYPSFNLVVAEALGARNLRFSQVMTLGGANPCAMLNLAARAVSQGWCQAVLVIYADNRLTAMSRDTAIERMTDAVHPEFERPLGPTIAALYAMAASRHMHVYGSRPEQFAHIAVEARRNAIRTEGAIMQEPITVDDVLASKMIASPLRMLDCCLFTDYAGAVVVTKPELAAYGKHTPVAVLGGGEGHTHAHLTHAPDLLSHGAHISGDTAFAQAGIERQDVDFVQLYDCFTIAVALQLEELGFCPKGEGAAFAASGALGRGGSLPFNTNGGMLSFHNGGIYHVTEAVQQLRHTAGARQITDAEIGLVQGNGGVYSHHATVIMARGGHA